MDSLRAAVEDAAATQLDRLGSGKLLIALTDATLEEGAVRAAAAAGEREGAAAFRAWTADEADEEIAGAFADAAAAAAERAERLWAGGETPAAAFPLDPAAHDGTPERVGAGLVGWPLVQARVHRGAISFFVNEADEAAADAFRDARDAVEGLPAEGERLLEGRGGTGGERERAKTAAEAVVGEAYEVYADTLEALGIDPRPIC